MKLPNLSYMMTVAQQRYVQSLFETPQHRNPDVFAGLFLSPQQRLGGVVRGKLLLPRLRKNPFYYYLLARTKHYDEVFLSAIYAAIPTIINIGCGSDTRAYRFEHLLRKNGVTVIEADQPQAIESKRQMAQRHFSTDHVKYVPLDVNDNEWGEFLGVLAQRVSGPVLVMMEGVSPYIDTASFEAFLRRLATELHPQSRLAYDFKVVGAGMDGLSQVPDPFRLVPERNEVEARHQKLGFELRDMQLANELTQRLLPGTPALFHEDCLLRLSIRPAAKV